MKKESKLVLLIAMILVASLVITAAPPRQDPVPPARGTDASRMEAAHERLLDGQNAGLEASRLTQSLASPDTGSIPGPLPRKIFIDESIFGKMERDNIPHAPLASDSEFLRRAYLDLTGLLPSADEVRRFLADTDADKRDKLIDSLVGSEDFADQWAYHFDEQLRTQRAPEFHLWLKAWLKVDRPYNEVFYDMVTPVGKYLGGIPAGRTFYDPIGYVTGRCISWSNPDDMKGLNRLDFIDEITSEIGRVFLGLSMECISCHNGAGHTDSFNLSLSRMKRTDFWRQAAFFGNLRNVGNSAELGQSATFRGPDVMFDDLAPGYNTADDGPYWTPAEGRFPRDGRTYEPVFFLTGEKPAPGENPRKALGRMLPKHIQFARATVNFIWRQLMVVGLVEPIDGFDLDRLDPENPPPAPWTLQPSHPELLKALAEDFRNNNFSIHHVIKTIMKSNAYQLSTHFPGEWRDAYIPYHARRFARVLSGPEAADIVAQATGVPYDLNEYGQDFSYVKQVTNPLRLKGRRDENSKVYALMQAFYQAERALPPVDKNVTTPIQAMMLMSSDVVTRRVSAAKGETLVARLLQSSRSNGEVIEELYLASLSRLPTAGEAEVATRLLTEDRRRGAEKLQWALLNNSEFLLNH